MRMTSGASRIAFFSALWKACVSSPTSRWFTIDFLCRCRYSIGSSMVRMWPAVVLLRWSIIDASVVDLPEPVEPTISTSPRGAMMMSFSTCGSCSSSIVGITLRIARITMPTSPRCLNTLTRKRHVQLQVALELRHLALVHQRIGDFLDHAGRQAGIAEGIELSLDLDVHRRAGGQEHVGGVLLRHQLQEVADVHRGIPLSRRTGCLRSGRMLLTMAVRPLSPRRPPYAH